MCNVGVYLRGDKRSITIIDYIDTENMRRINMNLLIKKEEAEKNKNRVFAEMKEVLNGTD